ncbi:hypothetical protein PRIPAC_97056 [Pristionchus pacificus]|uniref:Uncharacterized protein n=1 Tax=Pristionchus pacificus TaxID=54126 RepID=A0A2A6CGV7_PRIPA|nr:hypothetical protein PRIPAC_97056 [Pristionchus pacificus]|eukprot:PDM77369.1 hypothetical protein PRIPAC_33099 [Pristionchus pacificus]
MGHPMTRSIALLLFLAYTPVHGYVTFTIRVRLLGSFPSTSSILMACLSADGANCMGRQWIWNETVLSSPEGRKGMSTARDDQLEEPWEVEKGESRFLFVQLLPSWRNWGSWETADVSILHPNGHKYMHVVPMLDGRFDFFVKIECAYGFHGHGCLDGCIPVKGHHSCASDGTWVCAEGRWGTFCDYPMAGEGDISHADELRASASFDADWDRMALLAVGSIMIVAAALTVHTLHRKRARSTAQLAEEVPMVHVE